MAACRPEEVIQEFAVFSQQGGLTRGEEGLIVTMNTRWLPHYVRFRQMIAVAPVRYNFAPTSHDPLAQSPGIFTFHFDSRGDVWQCLGAQETGATEFSRAANGRWETSTETDAIHGEICQTGIESDRPITLPIQPILPNGSRRGLGPAPLLEGDYELTLLCIEPTEASPGDRVFDLQVTLPRQARSQGYRLSYELADAPLELLAQDRVDIRKAAGGANRVLTLSYPIALRSRAAMELTLTPVKGKALICGAILRPVEAPKSLRQER